MTDTINPNHYRNPEGRQIIEWIRFMPFSLGNAVKYSYRHNNKGNPLDDMRKALWYLEDFLTEVPVNKVGKLIDPRVVDEILTGVPTWERETCLLFNNLYERYLRDDYPALGETGEAVLLRERLSTHLSELENSNPGQGITN